MGHYEQLNWIVECLNTAPFFEPIAAFNHWEAAEQYALECSKANPSNKYRYSQVEIVMDVKKIRTIVI